MRESRASWTPASAGVTTREGGSSQSGTALGVAAQALLLQRGQVAAPQLVAALAETVLEAARLGLDIGRPEVLERYQRRRRADNLLLLAATDGLNRLFSNDSEALRAIRGLGLAAVDRLPPLKRLFVARAGGGGGLAAGAALPSRRHSRGSGNPEPPGPPLPRG